MRSLLLVLFLLFFASQLHAQDSTRKVIFPKGHVFPTLYLDPTECQTFGGFNFSVMKDSALKDYRLRPHFAFGFQKPVFKKKISEDKEWDIGFELASFTQFEWVRNTTDKNTGNEFQRNFVNVDYKIGFPFGYRSGNYGLRIRFYHTSSHLGDDYLIRNKITSYMPNANNYEQIDVINSYRFFTILFYGGAGMVVRPVTIRRRSSFQFGFQYVKPGGHKFTRWVAGFDIKMLEQNNFSPNLNAGAGLEIGRKDGQGVKLLLTYYNGNLPYSVYENIKLQWLGIGIFFSPI